MTRPWFWSLVSVLRYSGVVCTAYRRLASAGTALAASSSFDAPASLPVAIGRKCAMPLWQSMQVAPSFCAIAWYLRALARCSSRSMLAKLWHERHSRESVRFMCSHTEAAISSRRASNFCGVPIVPTRWWTTSLEARTLSHSSARPPEATWQFEQPACTPMRFWKCGVPWYSAKLLCMV